MCVKDKAQLCLPVPCAHRQAPGVSTEGNSSRAQAPWTLECYRPLLTGRALTFSDLVVKIDCIHGSCDDVGLAVACSHNPSHLIHELHGDTCTEEGTRLVRLEEESTLTPWTQSSHPHQQGLQSAGAGVGHAVTSSGASENGRR